MKITDQNRTKWMKSYIAAIASCGGLIILFALTDFPKDLVGLILFAVLAALAELFSVELFQTSRSRISVSSIMALSSILLFGPFAGALVHMVSGVMTLVTTGLQEQYHKKNRASWLQRSAFNTGMWVTSTGLAGFVFQALGGTWGEVDQLRNLGPFALAVSVDALVNASILIGIVTIQTGRTPRQIFAQDIKWAAPIYILGGFIGGGVLALSYHWFNMLGVVVFFLPILATSYSFRLYVGNTKDYLTRLEEMNKTLDQANIGLLETLGAVIDAYDLYTYGHSKQVTTYAEALAEKMNLPKAEKDKIVKAALVHDVGKIGIMDSIISKEGPLTPEERKIMSHHPEIGAEIVAQMKGLEDVAQLVRYHHERWDGKGYPYGIKGEEIPLGARIIALADSLDAMSSDRPYRPTLSFRDVKEEIIKCSGSQFDPVVVEAFQLLAEENSPEFFRNSAAYVDSAILMSGISKTRPTGRYLKRSMIGHEYTISLPNAQSLSVEKR